VRPEKLVASQKKASRFTECHDISFVHGQEKRERKENFYLSFFFSLSRARTLFISEKGVEINGKRETERGGEGGSIIAATRYDRKLTPGIILPSTSIMMASHDSGLRGASFGSRGLR